MSKRSKARREGRQESAEQFWMVTYRMARSPAFRSLSGPAVKILIELRCRYIKDRKTGQDNATRLSLTYGDAADLLGMSKGTAHTAFKELVEKGFVRLTREGTRYGRIASEWIVTDLKAPNEVQASNTWKQYQPAARKAPRDGSARVPRTRQKTGISVLRLNRNLNDGSASVPQDGPEFSQSTRQAPKVLNDGSASVPHIHSTMGVQGNRGAAGVPADATSDLDALDPDLVQRLAPLLKVTEASAREALSGIGSLRLDMIRNQQRGGVLTDEMLLDAVMFGQVRHAS